MTYPRKGLSKRKQQEWLHTNNPYPPESIPGLTFEADFYNSQAKIFGLQASRALKVSLIFLGIAIAAQIVALIFRLAA